MKMLLFCLLVAITCLPMVRAQAYTQPILAAVWNTHANSPSWARDTIHNALDSWNTAQVWFLQNYYPTEINAQYAFKVGDSSNSQVTVTFANDSGHPWTGLTQVPTSGTIKNETVSLVLSLLQSPYDLQPVIEHELGHVLGLDHTHMSYDLMFSAHDAYGGGAYSYPSTLNLYAVRLLAAGCRFTTDDSVTLPPQIPYLEWYPNIAPIKPIVTTAVSQTRGAGCPRSNATSTYGLPFVLTGIGIVVIVSYSWIRRRRHVHMST